LDLASVQEARWAREALNMQAIIRVYGTGNEKYEMGTGYFSVKD
jgi:hypothetical protein